VSPRVFAFHWRCGAQFRFVRRPQWEPTVKPEGPGKKTEMVRFRVPSPLKHGFMARMREEGRVASDVFRDFMEDYLQRPAQRTATQPLETAMTTIRRHPRRAGFAAIVGAAGISAFLSGVIPAGAEEPPVIAAGFHDLDADGDGVLTQEELDRMVIRTGAELIIDMASSELADGFLARGAETGVPGISVYYGDKVAIYRNPEEIDLNGRPSMMLGFLAITDTNRDGVLSLAEFNARYVHRADRVFLTLDRNGDGAVTAAELSPEGQQLLAWLDADANNVISREEFATVVVMGMPSERPRD
jgi:hypothetical protein